MNKQRNNKKHMVFLRIYPCSSELTKRQQLSLWGREWRQFQMCWRDSKRRGNRTERKDYWSVPLVVPHSCFGRIGVEEAKLLQKRLKRQEKKCIGFGDRKEYLLSRSMRENNWSPILSSINLCRSLPWVLDSSSTAYGKVHFPTEMF